MNAKKIVLEGYFDGLPDREEHTVALEMRKPSCVGDCRKWADDYMSFIELIRTRVTNGCPKKTRGLDSCMYNPDRPYLLVPLTVHDGTKFKTNLVIEKESLFVVVFQSGDKFYELSDGEQKFTCKRVKSIKINYSIDASSRDISPNAFMNAVIFLAKDKLTTSGDIEGTQKSLDVLFWYIAESSRFKRIFRRLRSYMCDFPGWDLRRYKLQEDIKLVHEWTCLCDGVWVAVQNKTNQLKIPSGKLEVIKVEDLNEAVNVVLAVLSRRVYEAVQVGAHIGKRMKV